MSDPKVILFDLGGVLIDFVGLDEVRKLIDDDPGPNGIRERWISSSAIIDFERGRLSPAEFSARFVQEWRVDMEPDEFADVFASWIKGTLPGAEALLRELRPQIKLACLSNTNALHWDRMLIELGLGDLLDRHYASHLCGLLKPDPKVFSLVCSDLGCQPGEVVFFDDGDENIRGALEFGMSAHKVTGPGEIRGVLKELGLVTGGR